MKKCTKCGKTKRESEFYKAKDRKSGFQAWCKMCCSTYRKSYANKPENRKKLVQYAAKRGATRKGKLEQRRKTIKHKYGITLKDYDQMLETQNGACAICHRFETRCHQNGSVKRLAIDHNHKTGKVRGLLCEKCNHALGLLGDTKEVLLRAALYLEEYDG